MTTLTSIERSGLERATLAARAAAELGIRKRLDSLQVKLEPRLTDLRGSDVNLHKALRDRAINLGKGRINPDLRGSGAVEAGVPFLVEELAYESWHRMLFARFLAENDLLRHPDLGVTLSVEDVVELAAEEGVDPWELAARYAAHRLPGLFHLTTPLRLASEDRQDLTKVLGAMDTGLFTASDSLGWTYQFWQAKRKDEVNASGAKITGATLPPVTQLFTEDYIVDFLLQNSLGAWFASRYPTTSLKEGWTYMRYREDGTPAAGTFASWPDSIQAVTVLDPCCGSGHFLVAAFGMLVAMRQEVEGLSAGDAADAVLRDNLFGLELDARCTQIATFAVALEAWKRGGHPETHLPQIACSGLPVAGQKEQWERLAGSDVNLRLALGQLYDLFAQAGELGSLIDPQRAALLGGTSKQGQGGLVLHHEWATVEGKLHEALEREETLDGATSIFAGDDLTGTIRAAQLLGRTYTLVATNVPYLSRGSQSEVMKQFADTTYPEAKNDLATLFLERCLRFVAATDDVRGEPVGAGSVAAVTPQNWLFLGAYKKLRQVLLERDSFNAVMRLGEHGFRSSQAAGAFVGLFILTTTAPSGEQVFAGIDASRAPGPDAKAELLQVGGITLVEQARQRQHPDQRIVLGHLESGPLLVAFAWAHKGFESGDVPRFIRQQWELQKVQNGWQYQQSTFGQTCAYSGRSNVLLWEGGEGAIAEYRAALAKVRNNKRGWKNGIAAWGQQGVVVSLMRQLPVSLYTGEIFDNNTAAIIPRDPAHLPAIWAFCSSAEFLTAVRQLDAKLNVTNATLVKVPFDLAHWQQVADEQYPDGLPDPFSADPTQWLFEGTVPGSDHPLQVAMARLLGYRWPEQVDDGLDALVDPDGIVCLPSVYQERPAHIRLRELLQTAYGEEWSEAVLAGLLTGVGATSLESWLRDKTGFFAQHVRLFHNRPFLWQITDSRKDGFSAIVNYHRLDANALSKLIYTYLGDWIGRQERTVEANEAGAQGRLDAAMALRTQLIAIAEGEPPYDLYVRWKSLAEQPIGWQPDLNDGVRLNIRPFIEAGVLASKVTASWKKDGGADPGVREELLLNATGPDETDLRKRIGLHASTERHNDLHFSRSEKERARKLAKAVTGDPTR
jgi:hypothetical protein